MTAQKKLSAASRAASFLGKLAAAKVTKNEWRRRQQFGWEARRKLQKNSLASILKRYESGETQVSLAEEYGVTQATISRTIKKLKERR